MAHENRVKGLEYISCPKGKTVPVRNILKPTCNTTRCATRGRKCILFSEENRMGIIQAFYGTSSLQLQREYIARFMSKADIKLRTVEAHLSRRSTTLHYHLPKDGQSVRVCQSMFLNTLNISEKTLRTTIARVTDKALLRRRREEGGQKYFKKKIRKKRCNSDSYQSIPKNGVTLHSVRLFTP